MLKPFRLFLEEKKALKFTIEEDIEPENRGWIVDVIKAYLNSQEVGYLKISYIPKAQFKLFYPSIINYYSQISGKHLLDFEERHLDYKKLPDNKLIKLIKNINWMFNHIDPSKQFISGSRSQLLKQVRQFLF